MYTFVEDKAALGRAKSLSSELMTKLTGRLKKKDIETRTFLIGSGGHSLVTQQEDGLFDLDYNLEILSCSFNGQRPLQERGGRQGQGRMPRPKTEPRLRLPISACRFW